MHICSLFWIFWNGVLLISNQKWIFFWRFVSRKNMDLILYGRSRGYTIHKVGDALEVSIEHIRQLKSKAKRLFIITCSAHRHRLLLLAMSWSIIISVGMPATIHRARVPKWQKPLSLRFPHRSISKSIIISLKSLSWMILVICIYKKRK